MYRSSASQYKWTSQSAPSYPSSSPGPMPGAPQLRSVGLPHPNAAPRHASSSSHYASFEGPSSIISVNPVLSWTGVPPLHYNVTRDMQSIRLPQGYPPNLLQEPAVHPARTVLVLIVPSLPPWSTIEVRNERGVSAYDVLARIRDVLHRSVSPAEMGTMGVKRIDFLGPNVYFAGLSPSRDGQDRWEVNFMPCA